MRRRRRTLAAERRAHKHLARVVFIHSRCSRNGIKELLQPPNARQHPTLLERPRRRGSRNRLKLSHHHSRGRIHRRTASHRLNRSTGAPNGKRKLARQFERLQICSGITGDNSTRSWLLISEHLHDRVSLQGAQCEQPPTAPAARPHHQPHQKHDPTTTRQRARRRIAHRVIHSTHRSQHARTAQHIRRRLHATPGNHIASCKRAGEIAPRLQRNDVGAPLLNHPHPSRAVRRSPRSFRRSCYAAACASSTTTLATAWAPHVHVSGCSAESRIATARGDGRPAPAPAAARKEQRRRRLRRGRIRGRHMRDAANSGLMAQRAARAHAAVLPRAAAHAAPVSPTRFARHGRREHGHTGASINSSARRQRNILCAPEAHASNACSNGGCSGGRAKHWHLPCRGRAARRHCYGHIRGEPRRVR